MSSFIGPSNLCAEICFDVEITHGFVVTQSSIQSLCSIFIAYDLHNKLFLLVMLWLNFQLTIIKLLPKAYRKLCSYKIMLIFFLCFHGIFRQSSTFVKFHKLVHSVCSKYEL